MTVVSTPPSLGEAAEHFRAEMLAILGYAPDRIEPGRLQRFATRDRRGDDAGWCFFFPDGEGGVFGDWRNGRQHHWQLDPARWRSGAGHTEWQERIAKARATFLEAKEAEQRTAVGRAASLWAKSLEVDPDHPYLKRKGVGACGIRQTPGGDLLIPSSTPTGRSNRSSSSAPTARSASFRAARSRAATAGWAIRVGPRRS